MAGVGIGRRLMGRCSRSSKEGEEDPLNKFNRALRMRACLYVVHENEIKAQQQQDHQQQQQQQQLQQQQQQQQQEQQQQQMTVPNYKERNPELVSNGGTIPDISWICY